MLEQRLQWHLPAARSTKQISTKQISTKRILGEGAHPRRDFFMATSGTAISEPTFFGRTEAEVRAAIDQAVPNRSEEHTSELQSLMRISYAVFCLTEKKSTPLPVQKTHIINTYK